MAVSYSKPLEHSVKDGFSQTLHETFDAFSQKYNVSIIGKNFEDILTTPSLFEEYVDSFTEGMDATTTKQIETLAESFRSTTLSESLAGVQPYASLSMPMLVKLWARLSIKYAVPTEPVSMPSFTVSFMKPYILGADGQKNYIPESINTENNGIADKVQLGSAVELTSGKVDGYNLLTGLTIKGLPANAAGHPTATAYDADGNVIGTLDPVSPEKAGGVLSSYAGLVGIDNKFIISSVIYPQKVLSTDSQTISDAVVDMADPNTYCVAKCNIKMDMYHKLFGEISYLRTKFKEVSPATTPVTYVADGTEVVTDTVFGIVNTENCTLTFTSLSGTAKSIIILGWVATDSHRTSSEVGFDITRKDITIGTGAHIESSLPIELLQDTKAMYQIDGAAEVVDIMSNVVAQKLDLRIYEFLKASYENTVAEGTPFFKTFDVYPSNQYAINPTEWLNELKKLIDILATEMKSAYKSYNGYFVILGNPIDTMIIPNVVWSFQSVQDSQNGVDVQYSLGAMSGANKYNVISSDLISRSATEQGDGELTIFFVPTTDRFKTYTYYPYTFNVVQNYLNNRNPNVPSIMLSKRDTVEEFVPIIGKIRIRHNDGSVYNKDNYRD